MVAFFVFASGYSNAQEEGVPNYAYAVFTGTGKYQIEDRNIYIFRLPLEFTVGEFLWAGNSPKGDERNNSFARWGLGAEYTLPFSWQLKNQGEFLDTISSRGAWVLKSRTTTRPLSCMRASLSNRPGTAA